MTTLDLYLKSELGQVWTPVDVALKMAREALAAKEGIKKVLDPACGPATFTTALHAAGAKGIQLDCYDVDERMEQLTSAQNRKFGFLGTTKRQDYLADTTLAGLFDLVIMNPPYIRQEAIAPEAKNSYHKYLKEILGEAIDRRANLFALFLLKGIVDLAEGGILCAIVYDAITQSTYGKKTLALLAQHAELLSSTPVLAPFDGVLVDAQILLYRKCFGGRSKSVESAVQTEPGCAPLEILLATRRGTALPVRKGYLASVGEPHFQHAVPFLVKQRKLESLIVDADARAYLAESLVSNNSEISAWLQERADKNRIRLPRVSVNAVKGQIAFNYYIRNAPRHLWNKDGVAIADNFYVSSTTEGFPAEVAWLLLNSDEYLNRLVAAARNQGNGLKKLQLYEYRQVLLPDWRLLPKRTINSLQKMALALINDNADYMTVRATANKRTKGLSYGEA
jgi:adenine-specific DNA-methyltransferase